LNDVIAPRYENGPDLPWSAIDECRIVQYAAVEPFDNEFTGRFEDVDEREIHNVRAQKPGGTCRRLSILNALAIRYPTDFWAPPIESKNTKIQILEWLAIEYTTRPGLFGVVLGADPRHQSGDETDSTQPRLNNPNEIKGIEKYYTNKAEQNLYDSQKLLAINIRQHNTVDALLKVTVDQLQGFIEHLPEINDTDSNLSDDDSAYNFTTKERGDTRFIDSDVLKVLDPQARINRATSIITNSTPKTEFWPVVLSPTSSSSPGSEESIDTDILQARLDCIRDEAVELQKAVDLDTPNFESRGNSIIIRPSNSVRGVTCYAVDWHHQDVPPAPVFSPPVLARSVCSSLSPNRVARSISPSLNGTNKGKPLIQFGDVLIFRSANGVRAQPAWDPAPNAPILPSINAQHEHLSLDYPLSYPLVHDNGVNQEPLMTHITSKNPTTCPPFSSQRLSDNLDTELASSKNLGRPKNRLYNATPIPPPSLGIFSSSSIVETVSIPRPNSPTDLRHIHRFRLRSLRTPVNSKPLPDYSGRVSLHEELAGPTSPCERALIRKREYKLAKMEGRHPNQYAPGNTRRLAAGETPEPDHIDILGIAPRDGDALSEYSVKSPGPLPRDENEATFRPAIQPFLMGRMTQPATLTYFNNTSVGEGNEGTQIVETKPENPFAERSPRNVYTLGGLARRLEGLGVDSDTNEPATGVEPPKLDKKFNPSTSLSHQVDRHSSLEGPPGPRQKSRYTRLFNETTEVPPPPRLGYSGSRTVRSSQYGPLLSSGMPGYGVTQREELQKTLHTLANLRDHRLPAYFPPDLPTGKPATPRDHQCAPIDMPQWSQAHHEARAVENIYGRPEPSEFRPVPHIAMPVIDAPNVAPVPDGTKAYLEELSQRILNLEAEVQNQTRRAEAANKLKAMLHRECQRLEVQLRKEREEYESAVHRDHSQKMEIGRLQLWANNMKDLVLARDREIEDLKFGNDQWEVHWQEAVQAGWLPESFVHQVSRTPPSARKSSGPRSTGR
jgi:hypothetical protein